MAVGRALRGFSVSAAARPTSSVPAKAKAAVTKVEQSPLKPLWNCSEIARGIALVVLNAGAGWTAKRSE